MVIFTSRVTPSPYRAGPGVQALAVEGAHATISAAAQRAAAQPVRGDVPGARRAVGEGGFTNTVCLCPTAGVPNREQRRTFPVASAAMVRTATADDVPAVAATLASAFHDDPLWGRWTFPGEATRATGLLRFMTFWAACGVRLPWVRTTEDCAALTIWTPPGEAEMSPAQEDEFGALLRDLFGPRAPELEALVAQFDALHPHDEPHYYLGWWATHRRVAGQGLGARVMRDCLERIDAEHRGAYLESTNPANLPRYEALGFVARDTFGPPDGPVVTTMWREAR
jgi:GNAT superfamily N-acetyltransferase